MNFLSFKTSLVTDVVIFVILTILFPWLSRKPGNAVVYYPNRILKGLNPLEGGSRTRKPFAWIPEVLSSTEHDVISMSGVDTAVYFVFLSTALGIMVLSGIILLPVLLPLAATDNGIKSASHGATSNNATSNNGTFYEIFSDVDKLSMGNIKEGSPRLSAFLIAVYWVSFVTYFLLWKAYKHVSNLRANALMSPEVKHEQFAIIVRDIPPPPDGQTRKEQVDTYFKTIYPETFYRSMIVTDNKKVDKIWRQLEQCKKKLSHAETVYAFSKRTGKGKPEGSRPTHKTGLLGLIGKKVDTIEFYSDEITELTTKWESERKVTLRENQGNAALVFFTCRTAAAAAAQCLHAQMVNKWTVIEAPEPRQILWNNLTLTFFERKARQYIVYVIVALTIFFYMIPIGFISAFTTLENLEKLLKFTKPIVEKEAIRTILEAYLPQLALIIFLALLPKYLMFLSKAEGLLSQSHAVRATSGKYFYFTVLNVFIGVTLSGTWIGTFKTIQKNPDKLVSILANSLPGNSTFFLTFVLLKLFLDYGLELSRIVPLIIFHLKRIYFCKSEDEIKEAWYPEDFGYSKRVPSDMLVVTIVLCYSVIAPLIIPFGALYFCLGWLIFRNQALKVYIPQFESYGRMWPHMHIRILASLLLFQVTMFCYFGVKRFVYASLLTPLPIVSIIFGFICNKKFYRFFRDAALEVVCRELKETPDMEQVFRSFIPQSLSSEKIGDDNFEDAQSQVSRLDSFV